MVKLREEFHALGRAADFPLIASGQADPLCEETLNVPGMGFVGMPRQSGSVPDPGLVLARGIGLQHEAFRLPKLELQGPERQPVSMRRLDTSKDANQKKD